RRRAKVFASRRARRSQQPDRHSDRANDSSGGQVSSTRRSSWSDFHSRASPSARRFTVASQYASSLPRSLGSSFITTPSKYSGRRRATSRSSGKYVAASPIDDATATASAVDMTDEGFSTDQPSTVRPFRRSRKTVTNAS